MMKNNGFKKCRPLYDPARELLSKTDPLEHLKSGELLDSVKVWEEYKDRAEDMDKNEVDAFVDGYNAPYLTSDMEGFDRELYSIGCSYSDKYIYRPAIRRKEFSFDNDVEGKFVVGIEVLEPLEGNYSADEIRRKYDFVPVKFISLDEFQQMIITQIEGLKAGDRINKKQMRNELHNKLTKMAYNSKEHVDKTIKENNDEK